MICKYFSGKNKIAYKSPMLILCLYLFLTIFAFHPALKSGFIWDDDDYVKQNDNLRNWQGLKKIWLKPLSNPQWYPLTLTSFWIEYHLWGLKPFGFHLNNIILHALNAFLVWLILKRLKIPGAMLAAAIFAIHPVHTESVAWISERKNVLSGFFYLAALYYILKYFDIANDNPEQFDNADMSIIKKDSKLNYTLSLLFFLFALLSKTIVATLPVVVLVIIWWRNGYLRKYDIIPLIPFFLFGISFGLITVWFETYYVGAQGVDFELTLIERCIVAGRALWFYLYKLLWPKELMFIYPRWKIDSSQWWQYFFPCSFLLLLIGLFSSKKYIGRGPLAAILVFSGTLFPAIGFLNVYPHRFAFVADHFQYLASIPILTGIAYLLTTIGQRITNQFTQKKIVFYLIIILLLLNLGLRSSRQAFSYQDKVTLWEDTVAKNKESWIAYNNLGAAYYNQKKYKKAIKMCLKAINLAPTHERAHAIVAKSYARLSDYQKAMVYFEKLLQIYKQGVNLEKGSGRAVLPSCYMDIATIYMLRKDYDAAERYILESFKIKPGYSLAYVKLGKLYELKEMYPEASANYKKALVEIKDNAKLYYDLGNVLLKQGYIQESIRYFKSAIEIFPDYEEAKIKLNMSIHLLYEKKR